jgi:hypothetical protein
LKNTLALVTIALAVASLSFSYQSLYYNNVSGLTTNNTTSNTLKEGESQQKFNLDSARIYVKSMYNSSLGLAKENDVLERYWLWSDNFLASLALSKSDPTISKNLSITLQQYKNQFKIEYPSAWAALGDNNNNGSIGIVSFNTPSDVHLTDKIWYTTYDGKDQLRCRDYADIAFLKSVYLYKNNRFDEARYCYNLGVSMFDGKGFRDKAFDSNAGRYSTYKLALWKIADNTTPFGTNDSRIVDKILVAMQDSCTGGVYTHYRADLSRPLDSKPNVETTSLSIMAFDS